MLIKTSPFHQGFTLLGRSSMTFAFLLILLYSTSFWFSYNASYFGIPAIVVALLWTNYLLRGFESESACRLFSFLLQGKPPVIYKHWLKINDTTLSFGTYKLLFSAINNLSLSPLGNLIFKSTALSGHLKKGDADPGTVVLKIPFSAIGLQQQKDFITLLKEKNPQITFAPSVNAVLNKPILKSTNYIHTLTLIIFIGILCDIGHATFEYVELLKRYYLSQQAANDKNTTAALKQYESAEWLKSHCSRFSLVTPKLLNNTSTAAGLLESRSKALWGIGKKDEALAAQIEAAKLVPKSFKINLRLARLYTKMGQPEKANEAIDIVADKHKHSLLPKLYTAALLFDKQNASEAKTVLQRYLSSLDEDYFSPPPIWPPAGEEAIHELFVRDDLEFLLSKLQTPPKSLTKKK
jgi:hypothetical protein